MHSETEVAPGREAANPDHRPHSRAGRAAVDVPDAQARSAQLTTAAARVVTFALENCAIALTPNTHRGQLQDRKYFWNCALTVHRLQSHYPLHATILLDYVRSEQQPLAPSALGRRLATIAADHRDRGLPDSCKHEQVKRILKDARHARIRVGWAAKRQRAATLDVILPLLATYAPDLKGLSDRAILEIAIKSGGRRPSEVCNVYVEDLEAVPGGEYMATLRLTKTAAGQCPKSR